MASPASSPDRLRNALLDLPFIVGVIMVCAVIYLAPSADLAGRWATICGTLAMPIYLGWMVHRGGVLVRRIARLEMRESLSLTRQTAAESLDTLLARPLLRTAAAPTLSGFILAALTLVHCVYPWSTLAPLAWFAALAMLPMGVSISLDRLVWHCLKACQARRAGIPFVLRAFISSVLPFIVLCLTLNLAILSLRHSESDPITILLAAGLLFFSAGCSAAILREKWERACGVLYLFEWRFISPFDKGRR